MHRFAILVLVLALLAAFASACGGSDKKIVEGETTFSTEALPAGFPKDFPIYGGAEFKGAVASAAEGQAGFAATWETADSIEKVTAYYNEQFAGASGWQLVSATDTDGRAFFAFHRKGDDTKSGSMTITSQDAKTSFVAFLGDNATRTANR